MSKHLDKEKQLRNHKFANLFLINNVMATQKKQQERKNILQSPFVGLDISTQG